MDEYPATPRRWGLHTLGTPHCLPGNAGLPQGWISPDVVISPPSQKSASIRAIFEVFRTRLRVDALESKTLPPVLLRASSISMYCDCCPAMSAVGSGMDCMASTNCTLAFRLAARAKPPPSAAVDFAETTDFWELLARPRNDASSPPIMDRRLFIDIIDTNLRDNCVKTDRPLRTDRRLVRFDGSASSSSLSSSNQPPWRDLADMRDLRFSTAASC
mmetsp:Transcript_42624/g.106971  ORF Transcript_42624/g.106971 Transcript_42624/m.106971 type:complete len:216 (-) Transcript_42624:234-881(-)